MCADSKVSHKKLELPYPPDQPVYDDSGLSKSHGGHRTLAQTMQRWKESAMKQKQ